jgi:DNA primase
MPLPPGFLDELRARLPVSAVVGKRLSLQRGSRGEFKACCPFHKEKTPSFTVNDPKGFYHCFGCGAHGDAIGFLMQHDRLSFMEAVEQLAGEAGLAVPQPTPQDRAVFERQKTLRDVVEAACRFYEEALRASAGRPALDYLHRRGLDDESIAQFRLGFAPPEGGGLIRYLRMEGFDEALAVEAGLLRQPEDGRAPFAFFRGRVIFPVADGRGRIVAFGGRILEGEGPKYVNTPETPLFRKGRLLYGLARARAAAREGRPVIVAEGYMDVIALVRAGFDGAVAPLGTALTEEQIGELWKMAPVPVLCFDGDAAGLRAAHRAADRILPLLEPDHSVRIAFLPDGDDPDSLLRSSGRAAMAGVLDAARPLSRILFDGRIGQHRVDTPEGRAGLRAGLDALAAGIAHPAVRAQYRRDLAAQFDAAFPWRAPRRDASPGGPRRARAERPSPVVGRADDRFAAAVLVVLLAGHPDLLAQHGEEIAQLDLADDLVATARQVLLGRMAGIDSEPGTTISGDWLGGLMPRPLLHRIYATWPGARPDAEPDAAQEVWTRVWARLEAGRMVTEQRDAARSWSGATEDKAAVDIRRHAMLRGEIAAHRTVADRLDDT